MTAVVPISDVRCRCLCVTVLNVDRGGRGDLASVLWPSRIASAYSWFRASLHLAHRACAPFLEISERETVKTGRRVQSLWLCRAGLSLSERQANASMWSRAMYVVGRPAGSGGINCQKKVQLAQMS